MDKPAMTASMLEQMIHDRLYRLEDVSEDMLADPRLHPKAAAPTWHERDQLGRNWNVTSMNPAAERYAPWVKAIVEALRWKYDLQREPPSS